MPRAADSLGAEEEPLRGFGGNCDGPRDLTWVASPLSKSRSDLRRVGELQSGRPRVPLSLSRGIAIQIQFGGAVAQAEHEVMANCFSAQPREDGRVLAPFAHGFHWRVRASERRVMAVVTGGG